MAKKLNLVIRQGETFTRVIRWESPPFIYKAITGISQAAPAVITAVGHGLKTGWRAAVINVLGMKEINAEHEPPRESEFQQVIVSDADHVSLNKVSSADFDAYVSGGYLKFYTPVSLAGFSARMDIKDRIGGTVLLAITSGAPDNRIALDDTNHTITVTVAAADTALLTFTKGVYDLELVSPTGVVTTLYSGNVTVTKEVTA